MTLSLPISPLPGASSTPLELAGWTVDPNTGDVVRAGERHRLQPRVMAVLLYLLERPDRVVPKGELLAAVWPDTFVGEDALWRCIVALRKVFEADPHQPQVLLTLPRRGYLLRVHGIASDPAAGEPSGGEPAAGPEPEPAASSPAAAPRARGRQLLAPFATTLGLVAATLLLVAVASQRPTPPPARLTAESERAETYYQLGLSYYRQREPADLERAIDLFLKARNLDPEAPLVHAGLANAYGLKFALLAAEPGWLAKADQAARTALELDPGSPEVHKAVGLVRQIQGRLKDARSAYQRAIELDPGAAAAKHNLGSLLVQAGELEHAWQLLRSLDPPELSERVVLATTLAQLAYVAGDLPLARQRALGAFDVDPCNLRAAEILTRIDLVEGKPAAARLRVARCGGRAGLGDMLRPLEATIELLVGDPARARRLLTTDPEAQLSVSTAERWAKLATAAALEGDTATAERLGRELAQLVGHSAQAGVDSPDLFVAGAIGAAAAGDLPAATTLIERAAHEGLLDHRWLELEPALLELAPSPRFQSMLAQMRARARHEAERLAEKQTSPARLAG